MIYICIHNEKTIEFAEEYPDVTPEEIRWARSNYQRLVDECQCRMPALWQAYSSTESPFKFEEITPIKETTK